MHHDSSKRSSCSRIKVQSLLSGTLHGEGFSFSSKDDVMKVFKEAHVKFQVKCVGDVYILQNSKITIGGLQLLSASRSEIVDQSETTMVSNSDVQFYPESRLGLLAQRPSTLVLMMINSCSYVY